MPMCHIIPGLRGFDMSAVTILHNMHASYTIAAVSFQMCSTDVWLTVKALKCNILVKSLVLFIEGDLTSTGW